MSDKSFDRLRTNGSFKWFVRGTCSRVSVSMLTAAKRLSPMQWAQACRKFLIRYSLEMKPPATSLANNNRFRSNYKCH